MVGAIQSKRHDEKLLLASWAKRVVNDAGDSARDHGTEVPSSDRDRMKRNE